MQFSTNWVNLLFKSYKIIAINLFQSMQLNLFTFHRFHSIIFNILYSSIADMHTILTMKWNFVNMPNTKAFTLSLPLHNVYLSKPKLFYLIFEPFIHTSCLTKIRLFIIIITIIEGIYMKTNYYLSIAAIISI